MSQIKNKNQEFVKTNHNGEDKANSHQFGYWKSLKDISSTDDYDKYCEYVKQKNKELGYVGYPNRIDINIINYNLFSLKILV